MATDIVSSEVELTVAVNQMARYADFLMESVQSYVRILTRIQDKGIQDDMVCARLSEIATSVSPAIKELETESQLIRKKIDGFITEVEKADKIAFPSGISDLVKSLLSQLL